MESEKLVISQKKFGGESSVLSLRLPGELVAELDRIAEMTNRTRNDVVQQCLEFSVRNIEIR